MNALKKLKGPIKAETPVSKLLLAKPAMTQAGRALEGSDIGHPKSRRRDTPHIADCKIGATPNLQLHPSVNVAPALVSSASPNTGGGYLSHLGRSSPNGQQGRKRNASIAELDSSPGSQESPEHDGTGVDHDGKRHPVKRACNECRQQKVSQNM